MSPTLILTIVAVLVFALLVVSKALKTTAQIIVAVVALSLAVVILSRVLG